MANNNGMGLLRLTNTRMIYKNFSGKKGDFNAEGDRNFGAVIDPETAQALIDDGTRVKTIPPRDDDPDGVETNWIKVKVNFNSRQQPKVHLIKVDPDDPENVKKMVQVKLDEDTINQLDWIHNSIILNVDMNIRFSRYPARPGRTAGISNYLDALYVTIMDDPLERKYSNIRFAGGPNPYEEDDDLPFDED